MRFAWLLVLAACGGGAAQTHTENARPQPPDGTYGLDMARSLHALREKTALMPPDMQRLATDAFKAMRYAMALEHDGSVALHVAMPTIDAKTGEEQHLRGKWRVDGANVVVTVGESTLVCERPEPSRLVCHDKSSTYYLARGATEPTAQPSASAVGKLPATSRPWTAKDYKDCAAALRPDALPRIGSDVFTRMASTENLARYRRLDQVAELGDFTEGAGNVLALYVKAVATDATFTPELFALTQLLVHSTALTWTLADELLVSLDAGDASYATRIAGVDRMRLGAMQLTDGVMMMQPPASFWEDAGADWAELVHRLGHDARERALAKFATLEQHAQGDELRGAFAKTRRALTGLPAAEFTVGKDGSFTPRTIATPRDLRCAIEVDPAAPASDVIKLVARVREAGTRIVVLRVRNDTRLLRMTPPRVERPGPSPDDLGLLAIVTKDSVALKTRSGSVAPDCVANLAACSAKLHAQTPSARTLTIAATPGARFADLLAAADALGGPNLEAFSEVRLK
jgi:hypothetical protein